VNSQQEIVVIYDGECRFCRASVAWLEQKLRMKALAYQESDLSIYGLTRDQCEAEVFAISGGVQYSGAGAVAFLLRQRGNTFFSLIVRASGPLGRVGYRWVASHRNSALVRMAIRLLERGR